MPRVLSILAPAGLLVVAVLSLIWALAFGGAANAQLLADPGAAVRFGLPIAKLMVNVGVAGTIGALVFACFALSPKQPEFDRALDVAAGSAALFTVSSGAVAFFTFLNISGVALSFDNDFGAKLGQFLTEIAVGQAWLATTLIAAVVTVLCFAVRNQIALAFVTGLALFSLWPMAEQGHAAGASGHDAAVTGLGLHLVFAATWIGGLLTLILIRKSLGAQRVIPVIERYSSIALLSFILIAISGFVSAELRIGILANLFTPYGVLVLAKSSVLIVLGFFGVIHRQYFIAAMRRSQKPLGSPFWWLVTVELAFMGVATGIAAGLARTQTPISQELSPTRTAAQVLTGDPLPPELTPMRYITEWRFDLAWMLICAFGIFFYLLGVRRMKKRGDHWPVLRTISWILGLLVLFYITNGGVNAYQKYLMSSHMLGHMALGMVVPVLLVPGAPVTLIMRSVAKRSDGSMGVREWVLWAVHSRFANFVANPIVAAVIFVSSLWAFYYTPLFRWAMSTHIGHQWMIIHFLLAGYLFVQSLIGIDPVPYRLSYPFRVMLLVGTMAFHAWFGVAMMNGTGLLIADWYGAMGRPWGDSAIIDQQHAGGIAWSVGEIPTMILSIIVVAMWSRSDAKESKRLDRRADRNEDAELKAYNEQLARLAERDQNAPVR